jgi:hypothetical protein
MVCKQLRVCKHGMGVRLHGVSAPEQQADHQSHPLHSAPACCLQTYEPHAAYDMKYLETIKPTHRPPVDLADRVRYSLTETLHGNSC